MLDNPSEGVLVALDQAAQSAAGGPNMVQLIVLFGAIAAIMYVFIYLPQRREQKAHQSLVDSLAKGDPVVLNAGIHGKVVSVDEATVVVDIGDRTRVTVDKSAIARKAGADDDKGKK